MPVTTRTPQLVTTAEMAEILRVTPAALHVQRHRGELPGVLGFIVGRKLFFDVDEVIETMRNRRDHRAGTDTAQ